MYVRRQVLTDVFKIKDYNGKQPDFRNLKPLK